MDDTAVPAYVAADFENVICGYHLTRIRPGKAVTGAFLFRLFHSSGDRQYFTTLARGVTRYALNTATFDEMPVVLPPLTSQQSIVQFIESSRRQTDENIHLIRQEIALLKEIDLRSYMPAPKN